VKSTVPLQSQSPAVKLWLVIFAVVPVVKLIDAPVATEGAKYSPMLPAEALLFVIVPT